MEAAVIDKIGALTEKISATVNTETSGEALYLPPGSTLARAEQFAAQPRFHHHHYHTERVVDLVAYAKAAHKATPHVAPTAYVQPDGSGAQAVFDHGDGGEPQWGHHTATLKLKPAPAWKAAQAMAMGGKTQQQVIDWLEDWAGAVTAHKQDGEEIEARRAITAMRRVKIEAKASTTSVEGDMARQRSAMESIEASGDTDTLPAYFLLHSPLYVGTAEHSIVIRLGVREDNGKPVLALRIVGTERLAEETSAWVEKQIAGHLGEVLAGVYVGTLEIGKP